MLSWSGNEQGIEIELTDVRDATGGAKVKFARELLDFATAATELDDAAIVLAREALIKTAGVAVTIDAAAVIANFEMMTRLADYWCANARRSCGATSWCCNCDGC